MIIPHVLTKENVLTWTQLLPASVRMIMKEALAKFVRNFFFICIESFNTVKNEKKVYSLIDIYLPFNRNICTSISFLRNSGSFTV